MAHFDLCDQILKHFASLAKIKVLLEIIKLFSGVFDKMLSLLWHIFILWGKVLLS